MGYWLTQFVELVPFEEAASSKDGYPRRYHDPAETMLLYQIGPSFHVRPTGPPDA